jgi:WD40 repeat protein
LHRWEAHRNSVFSLCLSPCGKYLLSGSRDAHLSVWLVEENYRHLHSQPAHLFTINHIVYSPDTSFFATAGRDKHVKIWDAANFKLLKVIDKEKFDGHVNSVNRLLWNEHYLISCSDDRSLKVWKICKK